MNPMGHPVDLPSKMPERNSTLSDSFREVVIRDCPGRRRSSSDCTKSISMVIPAGNPSITPPMPLPCDSPKLVRRRILPNELNISIALRVYNEVNAPICLAIRGFDFLKVTIFFVKRFKNDNKSFISGLLITPIIGSKHGFRLKIHRSI